MGQRAARLIAAAPLVLLLAALMARDMGWLARTWRVNPYYTHGPLAVAAAAWLLWRRRGAFAAREPHDAGLLLVFAGLAAYVVAAPAELHPLAIAGCIVAGLGLVTLIAGRAGLRAAAVPAALLLLAVPVPFVESAAPPLAGTVDVVRTGAQLATPDGSFVVGAPCSGLRSVMALVTLALAFVAIVRGPVAIRLLVVLLAAPAALVANWLRLTMLLVLTDVAGAGPTMAIYHPLSSPALFLGAAAGLAVVAGAMGLSRER
jgi:exosortase